MRRGRAGRRISPRLVYEKHFNTNYTASWFLVRGSARLGSDGNLVASNGACTVPGFAAIVQRNFTKGPIFLNELDASPMSSSFIPLLGDGGPTTRTLQFDVGDHSAGTALVAPITAGPRLRDDVPNFGNIFDVPVNSAGAPKNVWYPVWATQVRQDYRSFSPVHRGACNILYADGHVGALTDTNGDQLINNGFQLASGGFADVSEEVKVGELESLYSILDKHAHQAN